MTNFLTCVTGLLLVCGCFLLPSCAPREEGKPVDIVLISVDTLRPDHLSLYGYPRQTSPHLDR